MNWSSFLRAEAKEEYFRTIIAKVAKDAETAEIYPKREDIFKAFKLCPLEKVRAVCLAQDPYFNEGQAHGLAFSVPKGVSLPPSLRNIYQEMEADLGIPPAKNGDLSSWSEQGLLLLNSSLTVRAGQAGSHSSYGWHTLTDKAISIINGLDRPIVYLLWGAHAKKKIPLITNPKHKMITAAHPSPLSAHSGFFGSRPFSQCNDFLIENGQEPIDWRLE